MRRAAWVGLAVVIALAAMPDVLHACPVCFDSRDENRQAFLATTAFLSVLPLGLVGGLVMWIRKRSREADAEAGEEHTAGH